MRENIRWAIVQIRVCALVQVPADFMFSIVEQQQSTVKQLVKNKSDESEDRVPLTDDCCGSVE
jgi:hypothetical protein